MKLDPTSVVLSLALATILVAGPATAQTFLLVPDVPTDLGPVTLLPWAVTRGGAGPWLTELTLPPGTEIGALHRLLDGDWLFTVAHPVTLGPMEVERRDVVRLRDGVYGLWFDGDIEGVPAGVALDALFVENPLARTLVVSFDVPVRIAGSTFEPADLVRVDGGVFSFAFDASETTPPVPPTANVVAAARLGSAWVVSFDAPTTLGGYTFRPGQLVAWDGGFTVLHGEVDWPLSSRVNALSFPASPGAVPTNLRLDKVGPHEPEAAGQLALTWESSCSVGAEDYAVYEGAIGDWYSHLAADCSDDGADLVEWLGPGAGDRYFLIVPRNANEEGSYGLDYRSGVFGQRPRPVAKSDRCVEPQSTTSCF